MPRWCADRSLWACNGGPLEDLKVGKFGHTHLAKRFQPWWPEGGQGGGNTDSVLTTANIRRTELVRELYRVPIHSWPREQVNGAAILSN